MLTYLYICHQYNLIVSRSIILCYQCHWSFVSVVINFPEVVSDWKITIPGENHFSWILGWMVVLHFRTARQGTWWSITKKGHWRFVENKIEIEWVSNCCGMLYSSFSCLQNCSRSEKGGSRFPTVKDISHSLHSATPLNGIRTAHVLNFCFKYN